VPAWKFNLKAYTAITWHNDRPAWASNPDSPITVTRQRVLWCYRQRHRGRPNFVWFNFWQLNPKMIILQLQNLMIYWWNSWTIPWSSMTTVIFHDFPGLEIPFLNSMTFHDAWEPAFLMADKNIGITWNQPRLSRWEYIIRSTQLLYVFCVFLPFQ